MKGLRQARLFDPDGKNVMSKRVDQSISGDTSPTGPRQDPEQLRLLFSPQDLVTEFHLAFGLPIRSKPSSNIPLPLAELRKRLLSEEVSELVSAIDDGDLTAIAHELADVIYVSYGTAATYGIDLDAVVAEIHRSNMSKLDRNGDPIVRDDGKVLKGPNYEPPQLDALLGQKQRNGD